jgi:hypothetical protein
MAAAWNVTDDVVSCPSFERERGHVLAVHGEGDVVSDVGDVRERDTHGIAAARGGDRPGGTPEPQSDSSVSGPRHERARPAQDGGDVEAAEFVGLGDLQVVDLAAQPIGPIDELTVQQLQAGVEHASGGHHAPPLVMMISGIVATEITSSRHK